MMVRDTLRYTLGLLWQGNRVLLLNRERPTWMGCWNGVGGKLEPGEHPRASMLREIQEETPIAEPLLQFKGLMTWSTATGAGFGGMYVYGAEIPPEEQYDMPCRTEEGILDWKEIAWVVHPDNRGVATNLVPCVAHALQDAGCTHYHSYFEGDTVKQTVMTVLDPAVEDDADRLGAYLRHYEKEVTQRGAYTSSGGQR